MANTCPNINTLEWKNMLNHVGEREAYRAYIAHDHTIPNAISLSGLKRELGMGKPPYSPQRQININRKIVQFNKANGTSHRVEFTQIGESNSYTGNLKVNYLPVNLEAQADRRQRKAMLGYTQVEDGESFQDVYTPSESEQEAGMFNEEGDFIPPSAFPATSVSEDRPKFQTYIDEKSAELEVLYRRIGRIRKSEENLVDRVRKDIDEGKKVDHEKVKNIRKKNALKVAKVKAAINNVKDEIVELGNLNQLRDIAAYAESDMQKLEKLFAKDRPDPEDLEHANRLIRLWQKAGAFGGKNDHIFYTTDEYGVREKGLKDITDKFHEWKRRADGFEEKLINFQDKFIEGKIKESYGQDVKVDFDKGLTDVNFITRNLLDISEVDNILLQASAEWVKKANFAAKKEMDGIIEDLDRLIKNTGLKNFDIFKQTFSNTDPRETGEMVYRFSQSYFDWRRKSFARRRIAIDSTKTRKMSPSNVRIVRNNANENFIKDMQDNTEVFDARVFFHDPEVTDTPDMTDQREAHEKRLRSLLGDTGYEEYLELNRRKVERYTFDKEAQIAQINAELGEDSNDAKRYIAEWINENSPYKYAEIMQEGVSAADHKGTISTLTMNYVMAVPKETVRGKTSDFYGNKFRDIEANESYLELHNYMMNLLQDMRNYLPNSKIGFMQMNSIPTLHKKTFETITEGRVTQGFQILSDVLKESTRIDDLSTVASEEEKKEFQLKMLTDHRQRINEYVELMSTQYLIKEKKHPGEEQITKYRRDIMHSIAQEKSFDLGRVMKAFASMAVTYKHRSSIEDQMRMSREILERSLEQRENAAGEPLRNKWNELLSKDGLEDLRKMYDDFLDVAYWGYPSNIPEGKTEKKKLTAKEKVMKETLAKTKADLETLLADKDLTEAKRLEYQGRISSIEEQEDALGGVVVRSKQVDILLKYIQVKGMGWNAFAAFANLGFGFMTNVVESSDGRNYSAKNFWKAQALTMNSLIPHEAHNLLGGISGKAQKIYALMHHYDTLKESRNEIYKSTGTTSLFRQVGKRFEWANPYAPQSRSEYLNQAPVMIAMMMETMVTVDGKEMSAWDAYSIDENGKPVFPEGTVFSDTDEFKLKQRIDKLVKMNHGNYDPDTPLSVKRKVLGRALSQFRTWAFQGFHERFGKEKVDYHLIDRLDESERFVRKGRYRSYLSYFQQSGNLMGGVGLTLKLLISPLQKLVGMNTNFDKMTSDTFTRVDAANMRKNMTELLMYVIISGFVLLLKNVAEDDDDPKKKLATNFLINQMGRIATDILFYTNPMEFEKLSRNAIPAFTLIVDAAKVIEDAAVIIGGGEDILQSGPNKGESRIIRDVMKNVPGFIQVQKGKSITGQVYDDTGIIDSLMDSGEE